MSGRGVPGTQQQQQLGCGRLLPARAGEGMPVDGGGCVEFPCELQSPCRPCRAGSVPVVPQSARPVQRPGRWASSGAFWGGLQRGSGAGGPGGEVGCRRAGAGARPGQVLPAPELARLAGRQVPVLVAAPAAGGRWGWVWEEALHRGGGSGGEPPPRACCALSPGKLHGRRRIHPSARSPCGPLGLTGKGGAGGVSRLPGIADSVSSPTVLVLGFSLILHGSSTGSCDL